MIGENYSARMNQRRRSDKRGGKSARVARRFVPGRVAVPQRLADSRLSKMRLRPFGGFLGPNREDAAQSLGALAFSAFSSVVAGLTLASRQDQLEMLPGLLLFVPATIGLRGNVFGPFGSRLSTAIQTGQFNWSWRLDSLLGQNLIAVVVNSLVAGLGIACAAEVLAVVLDPPGGVVPIGFGDFIVVSLVGGMLASFVVLIATLGLTLASVRFDWDLDNVTAPLVTATSDLITLPALVVSLVLVDEGKTTSIIAIIGAFIAILLTGGLWRSGLAMAKRIVSESIPVLMVAGLLSLVAGVAIERFENQLTWVLLVLLPGYLGTAGALGGILANRLSTKVHLGLIDRTWIPTGNARSDMGFTVALAAPIFLLMALIAEGTAQIAGQPTPGVLSLSAVALSGGVTATIFALAIAYYGTLAVVRFGLDPDNVGIPLVTASLDVVGALTLVAAINVWGI